METTVRVALARNKMTIADLHRATGLDRKAIIKVFDGIPVQGVSLRTLRRVEKAVPGLRLVVKFEEEEVATP